MSNDAGSTPDGRPAGGGHASGRAESGQYGPSHSQHAPWSQGQQGQSAPGQVPQGYVPQGQVPQSPSFQNQPLRGQVSRGQPPQGQPLQGQPPQGYGSTFGYAGRGGANQQDGKTQTRILAIIGALALASVAFVAGIAVGSGAFEGDAVGPIPDGVEVPADTASLIISRGAKTSTSNS